MRFDGHDPAHVHFESDLWSNRKISRSIHNESKSLFDLSKVYLLLGFHYAFLEIPDKPEINLPTSPTLQGYKVTAVIMKPLPMRGTKFSR